MAAPHLAFEVQGCDAAAPQKAAPKCWVATRAAVIAFLRFCYLLPPGPFKEPEPDDLVYLKPWLHLIFYQVRCLTLL